MGPTEKRRWAYACAKALDEFLALGHFYETKLPVYIVRLFNTIGTRQSSQYGMVVPTFVREALKNEPVTVYGTGQQRRCFCSVHDVVDALMKLPVAPAAAGKVVNVGSNEEVTIDELAERVIRICRSRSKIEHIPYDVAYGPGFDDMLRRIPDISRANQLIGWKPKQKLDDIILEISESERAGTT
jgi:UDP-glucose 4-epimerase